jgi:hypothetical protein
MVARVLSDSVRKKITIMNGVEGLDEFIHPSQRPVEYGGSDVPLGSAPQHLAFLQLEKSWKDDKEKRGSERGRYLLIYVCLWLYVHVWIALFCIMYMYLRAVYTYIYICMYNHIYKDVHISICKIIQIGHERGSERGRGSENSSEKGSERGSERGSTKRKSRKKECKKMSGNPVDISYMNNTQEKSTGI